MMAKRINKFERITGEFLNSAEGKEEIKIKIHDNMEVTVEGTVEDIDLTPERIKQKEANALARRIREQRRKR
jgi:hypothetical protein